jgi:hypothetical protein
VSPATRAGLAVAGVLIVIAAATGVNLALTDNAISQSQQQWCSTLDLLTSVPENPPADPSANPSRVGQYQLYEDFVKIREGFGC